MTNKIYFIILNYNTAKETKKCVHSIKRLSGVNLKKHIIIIDNDSTDGSFLELEKYFCDETDVDLYKMNKNVGFSRGNNYGYQMVREAGDADFCVICNSDIEFVQKDFLGLLEKEYCRSCFHVCGPDIYSDARKRTYCKGHQSPMYPFEWNKRYVRSYWLYYDLYCKKIKKEPYSKIHAIQIWIKWMKWKSLRKLFTYTCYSDYRTIRHENVPIHGSCIIISKLFIEKEAKLFYPETNFYGEELLLYLRCKRNNYKIVFTPKLLVYHLQGKATTSAKKSALFCYENYAIGAKTYLNELNDKDN